MGGEINKTSLLFRTQIEAENNPNPANLNLFNNKTIFADSQKDKLFGGDILQFRLNQQFGVNTKTPSTPLNPDPQKVADALSTIKDSLSEGFFDWDVSHGDLDTIRNTFRGLTTEEANEVFRQMSDGEVKKWADELNGWVGSYSREEKQALFSELAGRLSGENLARFAKSLPNDGFDLQDLGSAIGKNAPSQVKVDFVKNLAGSIEDNRAAAEAVAETIIGLQNDPAALDSALSSLTDQQFQKLMEKISINSWQYQGANTINYEGELLGKMLDAVSHSNNSEVKARIFNLAALHLKSIDDAPNIMPANAIIGKDDAARRIRDGLTSIINSDTNGVVNNSTFNPEYRNGEGLTAYLRSMLKDGKTEDIGNIIARLAKGNALNENQLSRFQQFTTDRDGNKVYDTAQTLGYFTGALVAANKQINTATEKQADLLKKIFSTAAGKIGVEGFGGIAFEQSLDQITKAVVDDLNKGRSAKVGELLKLTFPQLAGNDAFYRSEVFNQYENRVDHVLVSVLVR